MTDTPNTTQGKGAVDWSRPIEAVHEDGRVVAVHLGGEEENPDKQGDHYTLPSLSGDIPGIWRRDGTSWMNANAGWRIRNVADQFRDASNMVPEHPTPTQYAPELVDSDQPSVESEMIGMLTRDHARMRVAGTKLAEAALYVVREHDGLHRLALAVSEWATALASEGDRSVNGVGAGV